MDFFAPIVDDPYDWGRIAAANALSDVYAMGGRPLTALQLVGWPRRELPLHLLADVMAGGADVMVEAQATIAGGHSIAGEVPVYGFSVTGMVDPGRMTTNDAARPGDSIVLTKPLGMGVVSTAVKQQSVGRRLQDEAVAVMVTLNGPAAGLMVEAGVRCATDVTGYGLLGHLREILEASGVSARLDMSSVPVLDGVGDLVKRGVYPRGSMRNLPLRVADGREPGGGDGSQDPGRRPDQRRFAHGGSSGDTGRARRTSGIGGARDGRDRRVRDG